MAENGSNSPKKIPPPVVAKPAGKADGIVIITNTRDDIPGRVRLLDKK
ncbi:hypothetical protein [Methanocalculus sp.]|nr:hypothetical protein [Methanocalculus sp.]MDG6251258.1 hypothetical protein [Methanocalculus sp.]